MLCNFQIAAAIAVGLAVIVTTAPLDEGVSVSAPNSALSVKGVLRCGVKAAENAKIYLYRNATEDLRDILEHQTVGPTGLFQISTNTVGRPTNETTIIPTLRIHHNCDDKASESKKTQRRMQLIVPSEFVTRGRTAKKVYDIGVLNLELEYPAEKRVKVAA